MATFYNRLTKATSPYLQQHAHNPVDWFEWGKEALQKAKKENKPLLISIGYSACHWCHVMERESYMDQEVADLMNSRFVSVKIDREERPDIDQIYIDAAQLLNGHAGWPLNVFALPDGKPFWAGTYFPKEKWLDVLAQLYDAYENNHEIVVQQAEALTQGVRKNIFQQTPESGYTGFNSIAYNLLYEAWRNHIDFDKGGFEGKQKFPMPCGWEFILQYSGLTESEETTAALHTTLKAMAFGGIYDHLGGGFARYTTDENWFAPHFEKMLYDNAQLVSLYAAAYRFSGRSLYQTVVKETLTFVQREMTAPNGGFYSALNADSEGEEGKFYIWSAAEIDKLLDEETAHLLKAYYNVIPSGNWKENKNILFRNRSNREFADMIGLSPHIIDIRIHAAKRKLLSSRNKRVRPSVDDKILTGWNALMLQAYLSAYRSLGDEMYMEAAVKNAAFIQQYLQRKDGMLYRSYKDGKAAIPGFLEDYACLSEAYLLFYQLTFDKSWLEKARLLADYAIAHFYDEKKEMFNYSSDLSENLIARKVQFLDNEMPSSNAVMAMVLYKIGQYFEEEKYTDIVKKMVGRITPWLKKGAPYLGKWNQLIGVMSSGLLEVAVVGDKARDLAFEIQRHYLPTVLFLGGTTENLPLLKDKSVSGKTLIYVCRHKTCQLPVDNAAAALKLIKKE